ncbi:33137_t:CDS:2, partial [Racocetra persica]
TIYNINAYPNYKKLPTTNLVKSTDTNAMDWVYWVSKLRKTAINKYKDRVSTSNPTTSNHETSSDNPDIAYYVKILIGNQEFTVQLDTGSSSLWVPNKDCTSSACKKHAGFDSSSSPTFKPEGNPWSIQYGIGSASGITGIDSVKIGNFIADNQIFGLANQETDDFKQDVFDGILGLAFDNVNVLDDGAPTLISTLINQNEIDPIFSFHFQHSSKSDDQGTFTLGGVDKSKFIGEITFNP